MNEERKEGVRQVWVSPAGHVWTREPTEGERRLGQFHTAYLHTPPEGAPEPGERRMRDGIEHEARYVYVNHADRWNVATSSSLHRRGYVPLHEWLLLPLAPPKPKYRLAAVELTPREVTVVNEFMRACRKHHTVTNSQIVASLLRIEEIPE